METRQNIFTIKTPSRRQRLLLLLGSHDWRLNGFWNREMRRDGRKAREGGRILHSPWPRKGETRAGYGVAAVFPARCPRNAGASPVMRPDSRFTIRSATP